MKLNFKEEMNFVKRTNNNKILEVSSARKSLNTLRKYVMHLKKYFNEDENIRNIIYQEFIADTYDYLKVAGTEKIQLQENALKILSSNPVLLEQVYNDVKDIDLEEIDFDKESAKLEQGVRKCAEFQMELMLSELREKVKMSRAIKNTLAKDDFEFEKKLMNKKSINAENKLDIDIKEDKKIDIENELDLIKDIVPYGHNEIEKKLIKCEKNSLKIAGKFLEKYGFLEEEIKQQNEDYKRLDLKNMCYKYETEGINEDIGLKNIFTDEYIDTLSLEQLTVLNAFWQNRVTKCASEIKKGIFIMDSLNLWDNIEDKNNINQISDEVLFGIVLKLKLLDNIAEKARKNITEYDESENYRYARYDYKKNITSDFKENYKFEFDNILPDIENDFLKDIDCCQSIRNNIKLIYETKETMIRELLLQINHNSKITNWGYIPEDKINDDNFILIGIDYPGFNLPLKLHMRKKNIIQFFDETKSDAIIPIYEGEKDMMYKGRRLTTKIYMPLTEQRESEIIAKNKTINTVDLKYNYIRHLGNLINKKSKKISKMYTHEYIDLNTMQRGIKLNGKFIGNIKEDNEEKKREH